MVSFAIKKINSSTAQLILNANQITNPFCVKCIYRRGLCAVRLSALNFFDRIMLFWCQIIMLAFLTKTFLELIGLLMLIADSLMVLWKTVRNAPRNTNAREVHISGAARSVY